MKATVLPFSSKPLFDNTYLKNLIFPLVLEQLLAVSIGLADTVMVASNGEVAVSSVSLVDTLSQLMIAIFSAFATGGAVVASQYLGHGDRPSASCAGKQLLNLSLVLGLGLLVGCLPFKRPILGFLFGQVDEQVMTDSVAYFTYILISFPFLGIYNGCAALYRSMGNSKLSLQVSFLMNIINIVGNALLIYGYGLGVVGAGISTLTSRAVAAFVMLLLIRNPKNPICIRNFRKPEWNTRIIARILSVGVPNGVEGSLFQVGRILVQTFISAMGTVSIAANAISWSICVFVNVPGNALGLASITVIGQCIGADEKEQADYYSRKFLVYLYVSMICVAAAVFAVTPYLVPVFNLSPEATVLAGSIIRMTMLAYCTIWQPSFGIPNFLRAAGDAKYTMVVSILSMWIFRVLFSYILGVSMGLGLTGVWIAMYLDWLCRGICFLVRYRSGTWKEKRVI